VGASLAASTPVRADVKLPAVISNHMVLQRDQPLAIWGWADPGEEITVQFERQQQTTKANDQGTWRVTLRPVKADGKAHKMTIKGKNTIDLDDILIGEVWLGSGQSNMEQSINGSYGAEETKLGADLPQVRLFHVAQHVSKPEPQKDVNAKWQVSGPNTIGNVSAVLYYFGVKLHKDLDVPVGIISSSWGGSPIEPWIVKGKSSGGMYNGMIAPVQPFALRGVLWYQGESNVGQGMKYAEKMKDLIEGWRTVWGQDFPFYFVQIAPWSGYKGGLPELWEAQVASLKVPKTGMVVVTDLVDDIKDIHPRNKKDVGERLERWALALTYGKKGVVYSGPLYKSMKVEGNKIRLTFAHAAEGLKSRDDKELTEFEIAGDDGKFVPAQAVIDGKTVVVSAAEVANPTQVRFGWRSIANPNLVNSAGLPASPFRTANWQGGTADVNGTTGKGAKRR
jgi:sialate O-acetylesterase